MDKNEKPELYIPQEKHLSVDDWKGSSNEPVFGPYQSGKHYRIRYSPRVVINGKEFFQENLSQEDIEFLRSKEWK